VKIGFGLPVSGAWATPANIASFARRAEEAGYASLWTFQRLLVPEGSGMEPVYQSVLDPMVALAFAAAVTTRVRLAVAVINAPFIAPIYLAKQAASLDVLCSGRHDLGIGLGWMPQEFAATGAAMERRGTRTEELHRVSDRLGVAALSSLHELPVTPSPVTPNRDGADA
jgi:alkanesulfonate monooxygenase SsuD/methylene tetrahydromethanopterin reductase-like flavin-dependent oxidoreductase (luciferase family)